ncbi:MAG: DUF3472 domain-containing protein [Kiritimatiellae bacterium]|jgi:hypothetical protein|nr:DUF3472 domain-containing protein [Kiritimatiellia bacterium]
MNLQKTFLNIILPAVAATLFCLCAEASSTNTIPVAGNSWVVNPAPGNSDSISHKGNMKWENRESIIRTYFKTTKAGDIKLALRGRVSQGVSEIRFGFGSSSQSTVINNSEFKIIPLGTIKSVAAGYHYLEMQGIEKQGGSFAEVSDLLVVCDDKIYFVKDEFYWGRRGPSVHLNLVAPKDAGDILYHYSEITVPEGSDVPGSYYMANGFSVGYFGIQANSPTERRILFSVWSPFKTNNPKEIPEDQKITLLKQGDDVHAGKFGGEGSGGQSYRRYFWKTGITYRFLLKGEPAENNSTDFTAWFFAPEIGKWELMASFRRPKTTTYLKGQHSFLENFRTETGCLSRSALYSNQWVCSTDQRWREIVEFKFSCDATGHKKNRLDFSGGSDGKNFFLKNCGFFDADVTPGTRFTREPTEKPPEIDFAKLP